MGKRPKEVDEVNEENNLEEPKMKKQKKEKGTKGVMNGLQKNLEKKGVESETIADNENAGNSKKLTKKQKKKLAKLNNDNKLKESDADNVDKVATICDSELEDKSGNKVLKNKKSKQEKLGQEKGNESENKNVVNGQIEKKNKQTKETDPEVREALSDIGQIKKKKDKIKNKNKKKAEQQDVNGSENGTVEEVTEETKMDTENKELIYSLLGARPEKVSTLNAFQKRLVKMSLLRADEMDMNTSDLTKSCIEKVKQTHQKIFQGAVERGVTKGLINTILVEHTSSKSIKFEDSD